MMWRGANVQVVWPNTAVVVVLRLARAQLAMALVFSDKKPRAEDANQIFIGKVRAGDVVEIMGHRFEESRNSWLKVLTVKRPPLQQTAV